MNIYKKICFVLVISMHVHAHKNQTSHHEEILNNNASSGIETAPSELITISNNSSHANNFTQQEIILINLYNNEALREDLQNHYNYTISQLESFATIKKDVTHAKFKLLVENLEEYLLQRKKQLNEINQFLAKEEISNADIKNFAPRCINHLGSLFNENYRDFDVDYQLMQLSRLQKIKTQRRACLNKTLPAHSLGNSEILQQQIDVYLLDQEQEKQKKQVIYQNNPGAFNRHSTKNSPLRNFAINTPGSFTKPIHENIKAMRKEQTEKYLQKETERQWNNLCKEYGKTNIENSSKK